MVTRILRLASVVFAILAYVFGPSRIVAIPRLAPTRRAESDQPEKDDQEVLPPFIFRSKIRERSDEVRGCERRRWHVRG
jgi:hypothetical protein